MAVNYTDLFENIGEYVQRTNDFVGLYSALDTDLSEISSELQGNGRYDVLSGQYEQFEGFKGQVLGWITNMKNKVQELLLHRSTVLEQLSLGGNVSLSTVLLEVYRDMVANAQTVDGSTVSIGSVTEDKENTNAGVVLTGKVLDGVSQPHPGYIANPYYDGVDSELAGVSDTLVLTCVSDNETDRVQEGRETFNFGGKPAVTNQYSWNSYGSGSGSSIQPVQGYNLLSNMDFENFTSNTPDGWTVSTGTPGTHILEETTDVYHGDSALTLTGNASLAAINLYQTINAGAFQPKRRYLVACYVLGDASISAGTLTIQFEGTGYSAASSEKIEMNAAALAAQTTYGLEHFYINMPADIPDDMKLVIKWTGTPSAHSLSIDWLGAGPVTYFNGIHFNVVAGSEKFLRNDRYSFDVTNNEAGVFQAAFRKMFGFQLPSDAGGTETIDDALAT
jgi:hypothetical protein